MHLPVVQGIAVLALTSTSLFAQAVPDSVWSTMAAPAILGCVVVFLVMYDRPRERKEAQTERDKMANDNIAERAKERVHYEAVIEKTLAAQKDISKDHTTAIDRLASAMSQCAQTHLGPRA